MERKVSFDDKPATKRVRTSLPPKLARRAKKSAARPSSSSSAATSRQVPFSSLSWAPVTLPSEAAGAGGSTETDFFDGLDENADDFMGLKEVEGVEVRYEEDGSGGKRVQFMMKEDQDGGKPEEVAMKGPRKGKDKGKGKGKGKADKAKAPLDSEEATDVAVLADDERSASYEGSGEPEINGKAQISQEMDEDEDEDEELDDEAIAGAFSGLDAADLMDLDGAEGAEEWLNDSFDDSRLPSWHPLRLHGAIKRALLSLGFKKPTDVQRLTLPHALGLPAKTDSGKQSGKANKNGKAKAEEGAVAVSGVKRDVVGVAQTGSGKTLAYGLPILHHILSRPRASLLLGSEKEQGRSVDAQNGEEKELAALILAPTRELALQVSAHLQTVIDSASSSANATVEDGDEGAPNPKKRRFAQVATVCGGMSVQKQRRMLHGRMEADIVVATPGRLWDLLAQDDELARRVKRVRFLVVDEADRMVETGHFAEMEHILRLVQRPNTASSAQEPASASVSDPFVGEDPHSEGRADMQTFVFSATLSKGLQRNLKKANRKFNRRRPESSTLDDLMGRIDFRDDDPVVIDLSPERGVAEGLTETKIECMAKDKDLYLYYFLLRYPGRTLVFVNSTDGIRRLVPMMESLGINAYALHSQLQQKQRLKHLDRFKSATLKGSSGGVSSSSVLLATDVAARGLDIASVDHVIHYQLPRSADLYVHRSGRTARAGARGVSVAICSPEEKRIMRDLWRALGRTTDIGDLPIEHAFLEPLRKRLDLARQIDNASHKMSKASHNAAWIANLAAEADLALDSDDELEDPDEDMGRKKKAKGGPSGREAKTAHAKVQALKAELAQLLAKPLTARGVSHRYITSGSNSFVADLINDAQHETMLGVKRSTAAADLEKKGKGQGGSKKGTDGEAKSSSPARGGKRKRA